MSLCAGWFGEALYGSGFFDHNMFNDSQDLEATVRPLVFSRERERRVLVVRSSTGDVDRAWDDAGK